MEAAGAYFAGIVDSTYTTVSEAKKASRPVELVMVMDTTGSMGDEIERVKSTLLSVTGKLRDLRQDFDLRYMPESGIVAVDYQLPAPESFPRPSSTSSSSSASSRSSSPKSSEGWG